MQKIVDFIRGKAVTDTSMALALKMIEENPGMIEECVVLLFDSMYETNKKLVDAVLNYRKATTGKVVLADSYTPALSKMDKSR
jgi:hypothetical protein